MPLPLCFSCLNALFQDLERGWDQYVAPASPFRLLHVVCHGLIETATCEDYNCLTGELNEDPGSVTCGTSGCSRAECCEGEQSMIFAELIVTAFRLFPRFMMHQLLGMGGGRWSVRFLALCAIYGPYRAFSPCSRTR